MSLKDSINTDLKEAMKQKDKVRLSTIRSIRALILEFEKSGKGNELKKEDEIKMLSTAVKKRREAIEQFENAGRNELADKEKQELEILLSYMPKQLNDDEILEKVKLYAKEVGAVSKVDFPKLMPVVMKNLKGQADGNTIRKFVEKVLGE
ncbi:MAG: GatB/YqeY domain-containing protein [Melioribacteraceae bacterium]